MRNFNINTARLFLLIMLLPFASWADVKLPSIFGDNMVLQQQSDAPLWGKADKGSTVAITTSWDKKTYTIRTSDNGSWKVKVKTPLAGGPYTISFTQGNSIVLQNVLIGEVWLCSGQSNMDMRMEGKPNQPVLNSNEEIATSTNHSIRFFMIRGNASREPLEDLSGRWKDCIPENVAKSSAAAYYFGKMLQQVLGVPVGLICSSYGGSRIEPWIGKNEVKNIDFLHPAVQDEEIRAQHTASVLFNAMIHPLVGLGIRGVIWHQGASNRGEHKQYETLLTSLIRNWLNDWGIGDFPFYIAQLEPFGYPQDSSNSAFIREAQLKVSNTVPNTAMACLMDVGEKDCPHPANKKLTGYRLAYAALATTYHVGGIEYAGPVFKSMTIKGSEVNLSFDHAPLGLTSFGKELVNFKVAGKDKKFYQARAKINATGISLYCSEVPEPVAVRYAFEDFALGELYNIAGLPASSFRTDDWEK